MTNATKTLALLFAGTLALALATSWSWSSSSSAAFQEKLLNVDTSAVQAVRIDRSDGPSVRLERTDGSWSVAPLDTSVTYPASSQSVSELLDTLPSLQVSAVTTRQPDKHPRYGVDSTGATITMLGADDEALGELIVGRTHVQRSRSRRRARQPMRRMQAPKTVTYVRAPSRPDVFAVEASLQSLTRRSVDGWRRKQLWAVDRTQIQRVDFSFPGDSSFTMQRAAPPDTGAAADGDAWLSAGDTLKTSAVSSVLHRLSSPKADGFVKGMQADAFGDAPYTVRLQTTDGVRHRLRLRRGPADEHYVAVADASPYVVQLGKTEWKNSVLQGRSAMLKNK